MDMIHNNRLFLEYFYMSQLKDSTCILSSDKNIQNFPKGCRQFQSRISEKPTCPIFFSYPRPHTFPHFPICLKISRILSKSPFPVSYFTTFYLTLPGACVELVYLKVLVVVLPCDRLARAPCPALHIMPQPKKILYFYF